MNRFLLGLTVAATLWIAACSSGTTTVLPPPQGKYSLSSLSGTYAFATSGEVITSATAATPMARAGSFVADGNGGITGGVEDVNSAGTPSGATAISGGSYTVNADGRGTLTLQFPTNTLQFGIVLTSTSDGLMMDETSNTNQASTGSGNFIKQDTTMCASPVQSVTGTYIFDFTGLDSSGSPESFVGEFTANNSGATSANFGDVNDNFALANGTFTGSFGIATLPPAGPTSCGRGLAQITAATGQQTYAYYVVDSTRIRFINAAGGEMLAGDAVIQKNIPSNISALNSGFVFTVGGSSANGGLTRVGRFTANGAAVTQVLMDWNDAGTPNRTNTTSSASLTYDPNTGRGTLTFQDPQFTIPFSFVFYLNSAAQGVIQETTGSSKGITAVTDGALAAQSGGPFSSSNITGTYGLNWSGLSFQQGGQFIDEEDLVGQATVSSLSLKGAADIFQFTNGGPQPDNIVGGSITIGGHGTGDDAMRNTMAVILTKNGGTANVNFDVYFVNPQLAFFQAHGGQSPTRILAGILKMQQ
jgi:hypothetical protein